MQFWGLLQKYLHHFPIETQGAISNGTNKSPHNAHSQVKIDKPENKMCGWRSA
ncbi:unnamed protein product [Meloidogyne enterolobii]|uniref:Uncharacterized protein n=1 Tax=Meloidogyne enterolobii TaxID=390850 RepID=A0ACB1AFN8_MELEN